MNRKIWIGGAAAAAAVALGLGLFLPREPSLAADAADGAYVN